MADITQADYEKLNQVAAKFGRESQAIAQMQQRVQQAMSKLQNGGWQGRGSQAFFAEMNGKLLPALRRLVQALAQASTVTKEISQLIHSADEQAASPFKAPGVESGRGMDADGGGAGSGLGSGGDLGGAAGSGGDPGSGNGPGGPGSSPNDSGSDSADSGFDGGAAGGGSPGSGDTAGDAGRGGDTGSTPAEGDASDSAGEPSGDFAGAGGGDGSGAGNGGAGSFEGADSDGGSFGDGADGSPSINDNFIGGASDDFSGADGFGGDDGGLGGGLEGGYASGGGLGYGSDFGAGSAPFDDLSTNLGGYDDFGGSGSGLGSGFGADGYGFGESGYGFGEGGYSNNEMMVPGDWLSDVGGSFSDSLGDSLTNSYDDFGIPRDWLAGVTDSTGQEAELSAASEESGGGGSSGGGSGGGQQGGGGSGGGEQGSEPPTESEPTSSLGGGGGGSPLSSDFSSPLESSYPISSDLGYRPVESDYRSADFTQPDPLTQTAPPVRLRYQSSGGAESGAAGANNPGRTASGPMSIPAAPANEQPNLGLPLSVAAVSPFLALLGKVFKKKGDE